MNRDKRKSVGYFNEFIKEEEENIDFFINGLNSGKVKKERISSIKEEIYSSSLQIIIASYSSEISKGNIKNKIQISINYFIDSFKFESDYGQYEEMLWLICLSILSEVELEDFEKVVSIIERDGVKDKLLDTLIHSQISDWDISSSFLLKEAYGELDSVIDADEKDALIMIKKYLKNTWYESNSDEAWYDSHKNKDVNVYFGYWAWETAALVKIFGWDDEDLKNTDYYPYDAVHW